MGFTFGEMSDQLGVLYILLHLLYFTCTVFLPINVWLPGHPSACASQRELVHTTQVCHIRLTPSWYSLYLEGVSWWSDRSPAIHKEKSEISSFINL